MQLRTRVNECTIAVKVVCVISCSPTPAYNLQHRRAIANENIVHSRGYFHRLTVIDGCI